MKKFLIFIILLFAINLSFATQFQENFDNILNDPNHHAGTFIGSSFVNWNYFGRNSPENYINGTSLTLGNNLGYLEGTFYGGVDTLKFTMKGGYNLQGGQLRVLVNDELITTTQAVPSDGSSIVVKIPVKVSGSIKLRLERLVNAVTIDDLIWSNYEYFENFNNILPINDHHNGDFLGSSGVNWTYFGRNVSTNYINGTSLMLANSSAFLQGNIKGGIDTLKFTIKRGFTAVGGVLTIYVNDALIASTTALPNNNNLVEIAVPIKKNGNLKLRIEHNNPAVVIDNLRWSSFGSGFYFEKMETSDANLNELMLTATRDLSVTSLAGLSLKENTTNISVSTFRTVANKLYIALPTPLKFDTTTYIANFNPIIANIKSTTGKNLLDQPLVKVSTYAFKAQPNTTVNTNPQVWRNTKDVISGWDWSLPNNTVADPKASTLGDIKMPTSLTKLEGANLSWKELEPTEGVYDFQKLTDRLNTIRANGNKAQLHIRASEIETKYFEPSGNYIVSGTSPTWLAGISSPDTITKVYWNKITTSPTFAFQIKSYNIYDPIYLQKYNKFIDALGKSGLLADSLIDGIYLHGMSGTRGEEVDESFNITSTKGIAWQSIITNWASALGNNVSKLAYPGRRNDWLQFAFDQGLGQRGGYIEMYLRDIEVANQGSSLDANGYMLFNDDLIPVKNGRIWDDENEEYGDGWESRFGDPKLYPHRFKESWMRALQSRRLSLWTGPHTYDPEFSYWCGMELGRKANNSPDAWSYLRESYIVGAKTVKNFERWVFQRDLLGYPTIPVHQFKYGYSAVDQDNTRKFDMIGRKGKKFGFGVDDNFISTTALSGGIAIKITYQDINTGHLVLQYKKNGTDVLDSVALGNSGLIKTATFFTNNASFNNSGYLPDFFVYGIDNNIETDLTLFMTRIIKTNGNTLPLSLIDFTVEPKLSIVQLNWNTISEANTDKFLIEKRSNIDDFKTIGSVKAKNTFGSNFYRFDDQESFSGTAYYRLKMFDLDGTFTYSDILSVNIKLNSKISLYPNPVVNELNLDFPQINKAAQISIISLDGRVISNAKIQKGLSSIKVDVSLLPAGVYLIKLNADDGESVKKFIKK